MNEGHVDGSSEEHEGDGVDELQLRTGDDGNNDKDHGDNQDKDGDNDWNLKLNFLIFIYSNCEHFLKLLYYIIISNYYLFKIVPIVN